MNIKQRLVDLYTGVTGFHARFLYTSTFHDDYKGAARFLKEHPQPPLSDADKREIDRYWAKYNVKFPDYTWFQMFYGITGIHDPRFLPSTRVLYNHYNDKTSVAGWDDKNLYDRIVPDVVFPPVLAHIYDGDIYDKEWNYCPDEGLDALSETVFNDLDGDGSMIVKVSRSSQAGMGVKRIQVASPADVKAALLKYRNGHFVFQRCLRQSSFLDQFCTSSVNIFRVITWRHHGKTEVLSATIRYGVQGSVTDISYINNQEIINAVGVNPDGTVKDHFVANVGVCDYPVKLERKVVPNFEAVLDMTRKGHASLLPFGIVAWDMTLDQNDQPVCIEYNIRRPGMMTYQFANGPIGGDLTEELLAFLHDEKLFKRYIPKKYRLKK